MLFAVLYRRVTEASTCVQEDECVRARYPVSPSCHKIFLCFHIDSVPPRSLKCNIQRVNGRRRGRCRCLGGVFLNVDASSRRRYSLVTQNKAWADQCVAENELNLVFRMSSIVFCSKPELTRTSTWPLPTPRRRLPRPQLMPTDSRRRRRSRAVVHRLHRYVTQIS